MHTPLEFYVVLPCDLFRLGRKTIAKMDYIRTTPPRTEEESWDIRIKENGLVDAKSGGLSLFNFRNPRFGVLWWKIPKGTKLPPGLHVSLDEGGSPGKRHFTVRPLYDMSLETYLEKLRELEPFAVPCFLGATDEKAG
jgi:hypothetical protein